jgi:(p)ppGpp synthase/HD superfamily hydrolase
MDTSTIETIDVDKIRQYAIDCHNHVNQTYAGFPYSYHLEMVHLVALQYIDLIPKQEQNQVLASCWTHDLIEDARATYNDIKKECGYLVAEITFALTNEKGRNRKERQSDKYYEGIRRTPYAIFVKLCDRIANTRHSVKSKSSMAEKYKKEYKKFKKELYDSRYETMFFELEKLYKL